jgi:hypothetical protein
LVEPLFLDEFKGETIGMKLTGKLTAEDGGTPILGEDWVRVLSPGKKK